MAMAIVARKGQGDKRLAMATTMINMMTIVARKVKVATTTMTHIVIGNGNRT
jgi:hypothetical protein